MEQVGKNAGGDSHGVRKLELVTDFEESVAKCSKTTVKFQESSTVVEVSGQPGRCGAQIMEHGFDDIGTTIGMDQIKTHMQCEWFTESMMSTASETESDSDDATFIQEQEESIEGNVAETVSTSCSSLDPISRPYSPELPYASGSGGDWKERDILGGMINEFDKRGNPEAVLKNLSKMKLEDRELDEIYMDLADAVMKSCTRKSALTEHLRQLFGSYVKLQCLKAQSHNSFRKEMCTVVEELVKKRYEPVEASFDYDWLDMSLNEIQNLYANDDPDELKMVSSLKYGMELYYNSLKQGRIQQIHLLQQQLKKYEAAVHAWLQNIICAKEVELEEYLVKAWDAVQSSEEVKSSQMLDVKFGNVLEVIKTGVRRKNQQRVAAEFQISRQAAAYALSKYCKIMDELQLPVDSRELVRLHIGVSEFIINSFFSVQDFKYTFPWYEQRGWVTNQVEREFDGFNYNNQTARELEQARDEVAIEECVMRFRRLFRYALSNDVEETQIQSQVQALAEGALSYFEEHFQKPRTSTPALKLQARINECVYSEMSFEPFMIPEIISENTG